MPMQLSGKDQQNEFIIRWMCFLKILNEAGKKQANITNRHDLAKLNAEVINWLLADDVIDAFFHIVALEDKEILDLYIKELICFNDQYRDVGNPNVNNSPEELDNALGEGEVVKSSAEKLFNRRLPGFISKVLELLDELLKLLRGS